MIVRGEDGRRREAFALFDTSVPIPRASQWGANLSSAGVRVDFEGAAGLPAFFRGARLISETAASLPIRLYRGYEDDRRPQPRARQHELLRRPNADISTFAFWSYVYKSLLRGNAYIWKVKTRSGVKQLYNVNPAFVTPKYDGATPTFELRDREYGPVVRTVGKGEIIHIPGVTLEDPYIGESIVAVHRHALGMELGRQSFEGRYIANDASPGVVLSHKGNPSLEQRRDVREGFENRHRGNAGRVGQVWGGWDVTPFPISLQDAQFIEAKNFAVRDIGLMLGIPEGFLNYPTSTPSSPEDESIRLLRDGVLPWGTMVESGLVADQDLFPEPDWSLDLDERGFLRADLKTRYEAYRLGRQGGWLTGNEARGWEGLPPLEGGDVLQETPVGGQGNQSQQNPGQANEPGQQAG